jgi:hypothetical protein
MIEEVDDFAYSDEFQKVAAVLRPQRDVDADR